EVVREVDAPAHGELVADRLVEVESSRRETGAAVLLRAGILSIVERREEPRIVDTARRGQDRLEGRIVIVIEIPLPMVPRTRRGAVRLGDRVGMGGSTEIRLVRVIGGGGARGAESGCLVAGHAR